jgi:hypothetical protein
MKVNALFPLAFKNVPTGQKRKYYDVIRDLLEARAELGFKNDVNVVFNHIHEIFAYLASDLDISEIRTYEKVLNDVAKWIGKDIVLSYEEAAFFIDKEPSNSDEDDNDKNECNNDDNYEDEEGNDNEEEKPVTLTDLDLAVQDIKDYIKNENTVKLTWDILGCVVTSTISLAAVYYMIYCT